MELRDISQLVRELLGSWIITTQSHCIIAPCFTWSNGSLHWGLTAVSPNFFHGLEIGLHWVETVPRFNMMSCKTGTGKKDGSFHLLQFALLLSAFFSLA